jgi:peptidoglycan/xylan/chitin deacetylase (PgdA/CDA1 family)
MMDFRVPILMYHRVSPIPARGLHAMTVSPAAFARHLRLVHEEGFTPVTMGQLTAMRRGAAAPRKPLAITFDDGFADFREYAMPCLAVHGFPATLFLTAGLVGHCSAWLPGQAGALPMLSWGEVSEAARSGIEIGGHTLTHPALDALPPAHARHEVRYSKTAIEDRLGLAVRSFAYPFGYYDRRVRALIVEAGYESACAVRYGLSGPDDDLFALRRYYVGERFGLRELRAFSAGRTPPWPVLYQRTRYSVWSLARRGLRNLRGAAA